MVASGSWWPLSSGWGSLSSADVLRVAGIGKEGLSACSLGLEVSLCVLKTEKPLPAEGAAQTGFKSILTLPAPASYLGPGLLPLPQGEAESGTHTPRLGSGRGWGGTRWSPTFLSGGRGAKGCACGGGLFLFLYKGQSEKRDLVE